MSLKNKENEDLQPNSGPESKSKEPLLDVKIGNINNQTTEKIKAALPEVSDQNLKAVRDKRLNLELAEYDEVIRETEVFYVPDIHGDLKALKASLLQMGLVDESDN